MNLADRAEFRRTRTRRVTVSVQLTDTPLIPGDPNRLAITFVSGATNRYTLGFREAAVLDQGVTIYPATMPYTLTIEDHGDAVMGAWNAISAVAIQNVTVIETILAH